MKFLKPTLNRFLVISLALISQIGVLVVVSKFFEGQTYAINATIRALSILVVLFIISEKGNPSIKIAWIVFILITPVFGSMLYLLMGGKRPRKWLRLAINEAEKKNDKNRIKKTDAKNHLRIADEALYCQSRYLENVGFPVFENTDVQYFPLGDDAFPVMLAELEKAEKFIFLEYFILDNGKMLSAITDVLERKVKEGVEVRLIYDDMGSLFTLPHGFDKMMEKKGIKCISFNPFIPVISAAMNNRDHRKILVIDSRVAFTGGINLADEYINQKEKYGHWKDNALMLTGDGVRQFTIMFLDMWNAFRDKNENIQHFLPQIDYTASQSGFVQPFTDSPLDDEVVGENVYLNAINNAKKYIYIFTPYLIPDHELNAALCLAAKRGVDVKIIVPGIPDKKVVYSMTKSYYGTLIDAGVKIYKYIPGFVHGKGFASDDIIACGGTINLDFRSMCHHFECGCVFYKSPIVLKIKEDMIKTLKQCEKITKYQRFKGAIGSAYHAVLRLIAPLM